MLMLLIWTMLLCWQSFSEPSSLLSTCFCAFVFCVFFRLNFELKDFPHLPHSMLPFSSLSDFSFSNIAVLIKPSGLTLVTWTFSMWISRLSFLRNWVWYTLQLNLSVWCQVCVSQDVTSDQMICHICHRQESLCFSVDGDFLCGKLLSFLSALCAFSCDSTVISFRWYLP